MGWTNLANPFEYNFDRGLYFHYVAPDLVVGSQPRHAADVDDLAKEGVTHILNLQQDKDLEYWNVSLHEISSRSAHHGMHLIRTPAVDFSPHSLRDTLPRGELACWVFMPAAWLASPGLWSWSLLKPYCTCIITA